MRCEVCAWTGKGVGWFISRKNIKSTKQQGTLASYGHGHLVSSALWSGYKPTTCRPLGVMTQRGPQPFFNSIRSFKELKCLHERGEGNNSRQSKELFLPLQQRVPGLYQYVKLILRFCCCWGLVFVVVTLINTVNIIVYRVLEAITAEAAVKLWDISVNQQQTVILLHFDQWGTKLTTCRWSPLLNPIFPILHSFLRLSPEISDANSFKFIFTIHQQSNNMLNVL